MLNSRLKEEEPYYIKAHFGFSAYVHTAKIAGGGFFSSKEGSKFFENTHKIGQKSEKNWKNSENIGQNRRKSPVFRDIYPKTLKISNVPVVQSFRGKGG